MLGNFHFNTETSLVLMYCVICVALLLALSLPLPFKAKQPINNLIQKTLYYLGIAALLPLWTFLNALRNLNRFSTEAKQANFSPLLADKHKGRVIKMQRNLIMGLFAVVCYVLLFRFHKVISRYDNKTNDLKNEVKAASPQSSPAATVPAAVENKKTK